MHSLFAAVVQFIRSELQFELDAPSFSDAHNDVGEPAVLMWHQPLKIFISKGA